MKKRAWVIWFLGLVSLVVLVLRNNVRYREEMSRRQDARSSATPAGPAAASSGSSSNALVSPAPGPAVSVTASSVNTNEASASAIAAIANDRKGSDLPPATVLENMRVAVRAYGSMFNGNPIGTNPEITKALHGDNPKQVNFIREEDGFRINGDGELVDPWGTPFFFHQLSATEMEIRSAGRDKILYTGDDVVAK